MVRQITLFILFFLLIGCGGSGVEKNEPSMRRVDIKVYIPQDSKNRLLKLLRATDVAISTVTLDVNSSNHIFMQNAPMSKVANSNYWQITTSPIPVNKELTFTAKAYNSNGVEVFKGSFSGSVNEQVSTISLPLKSSNLSVSKIPSLNAIVFNNYDKTSITFNIFNPNEDDLTYAIVPITSNAGTFSPNSGTLHFSSSLKSYGLEVSFNPPTDPKSYYYQFKLTNSKGEVFVTTFSITITPKKSVNVLVYMPPIIDSINSYTQDNNLTVTVKAHDESNSTLSYKWEKISGSATINSGVNGTTISLTNYQANSPVTLKVTVTNDKGSLVSRIFTSNGATVIKTLELRGLFSINNKLYAINEDGRVVFIKNGYLHNNLPAAIRKPTILNGKAYFFVSSSDFRKLFQTDGTAQNTFLIQDLGEINNFWHLKVNENLYFSANNNDIELYKINLMSNNIEIVKDINPNGYSYPRVFENVADILYFSADDGVHGRELWRSDGTESGTVMVKDINPNGDSYLGSFVNINGILYFTAIDGTNGRELWRSNGTETGTVMVKDINSNGSSNPQYLTNVNGTLYFRADSGLGNKLYKSDGTANGTVVVKNINPLLLTNVDGTLFFTANDGVHGRELWKSDGTEAGTVMVKDINQNGDSNPYDLIEVNGILYFIADDGVHGKELYKSDGTANGTVMLKDINPNGDSNPYNLTEINGVLYFIADDGTGKKLWRSDGTTIGTMVVDLIE